MRTFLKNIKINTLFFENAVYYLILAYILVFPLSYVAARKTLYMTVIFAVLALIISRNWKFCFESSTVLCIIFLLCALISLINVPHSLLGTAGNGIRKLFITCMFILAVGTFINTERKLWNVIACLAMACFVSSLDGIFQYVSGFSFLNHEALFSNTDELQFAKSDMLLNIFRARSNLGHPDALGGFLICYVFTFMSFGFFYFKGKPLK